MIKGEAINNSKKKRRKYEYIIFIMVIFSVVTMFYGIYSENKRLHKGKVLMMELQNIRSSISTYKMLNKTYPLKLYTLKNIKFSFVTTEKSKPYLDDIAVSEGKVIDPFGNPYEYDSDKGWVHSSTKGYENW